MGYALESAEYKAMLLLLMVVVLCVFEIFLFFVVCFWRQRGLVSFDFFFFNTKNRRLERQPSCPLSFASFHEVFPQNVSYVTETQ